VGGGSARVSLGGGGGLSAHEDAEEHAITASSAALAAALAMRASLVQPPVEPGTVRLTLMTVTTSAEVGAAASAAAALDALSVKVDSQIERLDGGGGGGGGICGGGSGADGVLRDVLNVLWRRQRDGIAALGGSAAARAAEKGDGEGESKGR
jgi:hypothetical protein